LGCDEAAIEAGAKLPPHFPFCSDACRRVDLGRWATGRYVIPGDPLPPPDALDDER
jgi:endogenous inhibitor of DNA gyrase (YacG/DUF329 family)